MDEDEARKRLLARLAQLEADERDSAGDRAPVSLDQASIGRLSRMDAMQVQAMALRRLDDGDFGCCTACGEEVAEARLQHDPSAALCIACATARG